MMTLGWANVATPKIAANTLENMNIACFADDFKRIFIAGRGMELHSDDRRQFPSLLQTIPT
jgi:hypothetical protein